MRFYLPALFNHLFLIFALMEIGILLDWRQLFDFFRKPGLLFSVLIVNLGLIPLLGWGLAQLFGLSGDFKAGILLLAGVPGGMAALRYAKTVHQKLAFVAGLEFLLTFAALFISPLLAARLFPREFHFRAQTLELAAWMGGFIVLPLLLGAALRRFLPQVARHLIRPCFWLSSLGFLLVGITSYALKRHAYRELGGEMLLALLLLIVVSMLLGWFSLPRGSDLWERRIAAMSSSSRNIGMGLLVIHHFYQKSNVDMVIVAFMGLLIPVNLLFFLFHRFRERHKKLETA